MDNHSEIMNMLGRIDGRLEGIENRLDVSNGRLAEHDKQITRHEAWQNNMKGKLSVLGLAWGVVITMLAIVVNKLWR